MRTHDGSSLILLARAGCLHQHKQLSNCAHDCTRTLTGTQARTIIDQHILETGSILLQGLPITDPEACEAFVSGMGFTNQKYEPYGGHRQKVNNNSNSSRLLLVALLFAGAIRHSKLCCPLLLHPYQFTKRHAILGGGTLQCMCFKPACLLAVALLHVCVSPAPADPWPGCSDQRGPC